MIAQPYEMLIIFLLFSGAFVLPMSMAWYYTPWKPRGLASTAKWIRYYNNRNSGYFNRIKFEKYFFINIFLALAFLFFFGWLGSGCSQVKHRNCVAKCEYDIYYDVQQSNPIEKGRAVK